MRKEDSDVALKFVVGFAMVTLIGSLYLWSEALFSPSWWSAEEIRYGGEVSEVPYSQPNSMCTQEAMQCPDGVTYVGRTGSNCEFAACPTAQPTRPLDELTFEEHEKANRSGCGNNDPYFLVEKRNSKNAPQTIFTAYSADPKFSVDFGKYGFQTTASGNILFGPWSIIPNQEGNDCNDQLTQVYTMEFQSSKVKDSIVSDIQKKESENIVDPDTGMITDGVEFKNVLTIQGKQVVVWEDWGGLPTHEWHFEIPGKRYNLHFHANYYILPDMDQEGYQFFLNVISTLKNFD